MSALTFRILNELTLAVAVVSAVVADVLALLGQADQALMVWALAALAVGVVSIVVNAALEQFRPSATKVDVR